VGKEEADELYHSRSNGGARREHCRTLITQGLNRSSDIVSRHTHFSRAIVYVVVEPAAHMGSAGGEKEGVVEGTDRK